MGLVHGDVTGKINACAKMVYARIGSGFFERLYENALAIEMGKAGLSFEQQREIEVLYDGIVIGRYVADFVVEDVVIVELKAVPVLSDVHEVQLLNYLRATGLEVGLLINFGDQLEIKRKAYQVAKKRSRDRG